MKNLNIPRIVVPNPIMKYVNELMSTDEKLLSQYKHPEPICCVNVELYLMRDRDP